VKGSWRVFTGATAGLVVLALLPACAAGKEVDVHMTGPLTITWHGAAGRVCAAAGVCGVVGSIQVSTGNLTSGGPRLALEVFDDSAVVRVSESQPGGPPITCADPLAVDFSMLVRGGKAVIGGPFAGDLPSAARCAGPTARDLSKLVLPARRTSYGYDMSGRTRVGAGPFEVAVSSGLQAHVHSSSDGHRSGGPVNSPPPRARSALTEQVRLSYRLLSFALPLTIVYSGSASPDCATLGSCGLTGTMLGNPTIEGRRLDFFGWRIVKRPLARRAALAELRSGRMQVWDDSDRLGIRTALRVDLSGPAGQTCRNRNLSSAMSLSTSVSHGVDHLALDPTPQFGVGFPPEPDPLRTRCPGPSSAEIQDGGPLATGALPLQKLGAPRLEVPMAGNGHFRDSLYAGTRSINGGIRLQLAAVSFAAKRETLP
jgi:hypothetical protein